ncbi:MAG: SDR family NAD(P)-dependent oxidoreductase [Halioglobus sp.]|nr:SDR family NAD(P)-dependent oxidoreductase [Halioglobus sp.]
MNIAIVFGVGASNGLGAAIARRFADGGLHTVVVGRSQGKLDTVSNEINATGATCTPYVADATIAAQVQGAIDAASSLGTVEVQVCNVGNNLPLSFNDLTEELFEQFWRTCTLSGFLAAKAALPALIASGGSLLFTGASASLRGRPGFAHFSAAKAGLRNLAQAVAKEYGPQGVHVGHVVVDGVINGEIVRNAFGEYLDNLGPDGSLEPDAIAESFWQLHRQPRNAWTFELDIRPFKESW